MGPDGANRDKEARPEQRRFSEKSKANLGCKLILGLVEGVSCRLQSRDSPLDTLQGQAGKPELTAPRTSVFPTRATLLSPVPAPRVARASFSRWGHQPSVPSREVSSPGTDHHPGFISSQTVPKQ